ncbi:AtpZ/AtpI family protein [Maridesulfovibrio sp.]|uniref:AtpZ/AtpI family protein n=1 Tax=Maridesulfovibrio sp. TaxID=2795000 RepID=UPI0029F59AE9|nr:AtpZ/AtpI family protein [Maridesulfovibrio sp.]
MSKRKPPEQNTEKFRRCIGSKEQRKMRAVQKGTVGTLSAFGSMGAVGWLVALPVVLGSLLGAWIDYRWPSMINWTLAMLGAGLAVGCLLAGIWMNREKNKILKERDEWESRNLKQKDVEDDN